MRPDTLMRPDTPQLHTKARIHRLSINCVSKHSQGAQPHVAAVDKQNSSVEVFTRTGYTRRKQ
jgi:hypothetical protein